MTTSLDNISRQLEDILGVLNAKVGNLNISPKQVITIGGLSDIDARLGLVQAGEFRSGNGKLPGDGFTGGRFGYPGFAYGSTEYFLAGVINDVIQIGLAISDGKLYGGGGNVVIDAQGIVMANSATSWFNFKDASGGVGLIGFAADPNNDLEIVNLATSPDGTISFFLKNTSGTTCRVLQLKKHTTISDAFEINLNPSGGAAFLAGRAAFGLDHFIDWLNGAGTGSATVTFNERNKNIDFVIQSMLENSFFFVDASAETLAIVGATSIGKNTGGYYTFQLNRSLERVELINDSGEAVHIFDPAGTSYFNEPNSDIDYNMETVNNPKAFALDASTDAITSLAWGGWHSREFETWTRTGNHTFTVSGDVTGIYRKGTKIRYKEGASYEFGVIISSSYSSPNTTVNLLVNTDYTMGADPSDNWISHIENPFGFPKKFNFSPSWNNVTVGNGTVVSEYTMTANGVLRGHITLVFGSTTSFSGGAVSVAHPVTPASGSYAQTEVAGFVRCKDATGGNAVQGAVNLASTTLAPIVFDSSGTYVIAQSVTPTVPFTWAQSDDIEFNFEYFT